MIIENKLKLIDDFMETHQSGINTLYKTNLKSDNNIISFLENLKKYLIQNINPLLIKANNLAEINLDLLYMTNEFVKSLTPKIVFEEKKYLCPGCLFLGKSTIMIPGASLKCNECNSLFKKEIDLKYKNFYKLFSYHSLTGFKCTDCNRFIPSSAINNTNIICPYFDCMFVGDSASLKKMRHPILSSDNENIYSEITQPLESTVCQNHLPKELKENFDCIKSVIETQTNELVYSKSNFTLNHKILVYKSFSNLLDKYPEEMIDYLLNQSRTGGFQHKLFQEYICLLEQSMPFVIKKNNKVIRIDNLLHPHLCIFDGISIFEANVNNGLVKNNTQEYYIGGRQASYTKPFYIGKILSIVNNQDKQSLLNNITEYSFNKIKLKNTPNNTSVTVTHLRIPPHYQMGGMVYINRIRKDIVAGTKEKLNV
jgi:hypothetical protein